MTGWILWNLSIEQRRLWEDELLDLYVGTLKDHGVSNYGRRRLRREHRGTILVMLGIGIGNTARLPVLSASEREQYDAEIERLEAAFGLQYWAYRAWRRPASVPG